MRQLCVSRTRHAGGVILHLARLLVVYGFVGESLHMGSVLGGLSMNWMMLEMLLESSP